MLPDGHEWVLIEGSSTDCHIRVKVNGQQAAAGVYNSVMAKLALEGIKLLTVLGNRRGALSCQNMYVMSKMYVMLPALVMRVLSLATCHEVTACLLKCSHCITLAHHSAGMLSAAVHVVNSMQ